MNWKALIKRIKKRGKMTEADIAKKVGVTQQNINRIKNTNHDPIWSLGEKLIKLDKNIRKL